MTRFQMGWKVQLDTPAHRHQVLTGRSEVALELARYYAARHAADEVVVCGDDGDVVQRIACTA